MQVSGGFAVAAPVDRVWDSLLDARTLPIWIPGCIWAEWRDEGHVKAEVEQSLALLKARFQVDFAVAEREAPRHIRLVGEGTCPDLGSKVDLCLDLALRPAEGGTATTVQYHATWALTGRLAAVGQFILRAKAGELQRSLAESVKGGLGIPPGGAS